MLRPSMADLEAVAATGSLDGWLASAPEAARAELRRALEIDRALWTLYPDSIASCLLARTLRRRGLEDLHADWTRELDERDRPWIAALRPLPVADGLLAELHDAPELALSEGGRLSFDSDDVVSARPLTSIHKNPRRSDGLRWAWRRREVSRFPETPARRARDGYPKIETGGWGPAFLTVAPKAPRIELPCPADGKADAQVMADGTHILVYGTLDEYAGGFVYIVDAATRAIERTLETQMPVTRVHECARRELLLIEMQRGLAAWRGDSIHELPIALDSRWHGVSLSPSGAYVAVLDTSLRIWSLTELIEAGGELPTAGYPTCFDPRGDRLLSGKQLFDGHGGQQVAELTPQFVWYLVGGPVAPWLHYGTQHLIVTHGRVAVYDARTGRALPVLDARSYSHRDAVAYDEAGTRMAALKGQSSRVVLHTLPTGQTRELMFALEGSAIAISPDGERIAIQRRGAVEIRTADGALLQRHHGTSRSAREAKRAREGEPVVRHPPSHVTQDREATLRFSRDGRRIARFVPGTGWRIWEPGKSDVEHLAADRPLDDVADFAAPWPADWTIEADSKTVFTHQPTGTRIALPVCGPWVSNPADPRILACDGLHIALRSAV
jgi:hypothetical protein